MQFTDWISNNWEIVVSAISSIATFIVLIITRNAKSAKKITEVLEKFMIEIRDPYYYESVKKMPKQVGHTYQKQYRYNQQTGELVDTGETVDLNEQVASAYTTSLEKAIETMLPPEPTDIKTVTTKLLRSRQQELDELTELINVAEEYRSKYNLPSEMSVNEIYMFIDSESKRLKQKLTAATAVTNKKEVTPDEEN